MRAIIFLPTQGPHLPRCGPEEQFDWKEQCRIAASLQSANEDSLVYVPSAFQQSGARSELEFYGDELSAKGVSADAMLLDPHGLDTVGQCGLALAMAAKENARLIAVTCAAQIMRVGWLMRGHRVKHVIAFGTPSRRLLFTNFVLTLLFPVIDLLGLRQGWQRLVTRRRLLGKQ